MDEELNGWMENGSMDGCMHVWIDAYMHEWMHGNTFYQGIFRQRT